MTLNKRISLSCFPFYRTSRGCRPRKSREMVESAQIRGELSAGFPGFLRNIPEFLTPANRATGHVVVPTSRVRERAAGVRSLWRFARTQGKSSVLRADLTFSGKEKLHIAKK